LQWERRRGDALGMAKRKYTDEEKAACLAALAASGGNLSQAARSSGVPRNTLRRWLEEQQAAPPAPSVATPKKEPSDTPPTLAALVPVVAGKLADKLEAIAHRIADVMPGKIEASSLPQLAVSLGITIEKMRLLREQATSIGKDLTDDERTERLRELAERVRSRAPAPVDCRGAG
jgi:transposase-like protein